MGNMPIGLFKRRNDGLGDLSVSPCSKSRNAGRVIWDHRRGEHKSPPYPLNVAPTNLRLTMNLEVDDSRLKCGNKKGRTISDRASLLHREFDKAPGKC